MLFAMMAKSIGRALFPAVLAVASAACASSGEKRAETPAAQASADSQVSRPAPGTLAKAWPLLDGDSVGSGNGRRSRFVWDQGIAMPEPRERDRVRPDDEVEIQVETPEAANDSTTPKRAVSAVGTSSAATARRSR